jgi:hypothetical protein
VNNDNLQTSNSKKINISKFTSSKPQFDFGQYCAHVSRDVTPEEKNDVKLLESESLSGDVSGDASGDDSIEFSVVDIEFQLKVAEELHELPGLKLISISEGSLPESEKIALSNAFKMKLSGSDCSKRVATERKSEKKSKSKILRKYHK